MMTGWFWLLISEVGSGLCGCIVWGLCWSRAPGRDYLLEESYWGHSSQEAQSERMVLDLRKPFKDTNQEPNLLQLTSALRVLSCPNSTIRPDHPLGNVQELITVYCLWQRLIPSPMRGCGGTCLWSHYQGGRSIRTMSLIPPWHTLLTFISEDK